MNRDLYQSFLASVSGTQWKRIDTVRRSGVATPLFSLYSGSSIGIGEIPDLKRLADWCAQCGMSVIQLLPMNDVGFEFRPYDAQSSFGLDPMYLSLEGLKEIDLSPFKKDIQKLRKKFPAGKPRVDYKIKGAKLELLWKMFRSSASRAGASVETYERENRFWLHDYALFKALKEISGQKAWEEWTPGFRSRDPQALKEFETKQSEVIRFQKWLQWQLAEQFKEVKDYAASQKVLLMGDLPFLVSRDSADVWAHQNYFKLHLVSGAPPDEYYAKGQRWGMPAYHWDEIAAHGFDYPIAKVKYAEQFYDFFRIDHVVGVFRLWTIDMHEPPENEGQNGKFDPADENLWEEHGKRILRSWIENTRMLPCAEDLGTVPDCSYRTLEQFGIPGINVQRWVKEWATTREFKAPEEYRKNSIAVLSTHDSSSFVGWWEYEAGTVDGILFKRVCENSHLNFEEIKDKLFDPARSHYGRLRWNDSIQDVPALLWVLGRPENEVSRIVDMYKGSQGEKQKFWNYAGLRGSFEEKCSWRLLDRALSRVLATASIFSVQLMQDWLSLSASFRQDPWNFRINFPGTMNDKNWSIVMPLSLEELNQSDKIGRASCRERV